MSYVHPPNRQLYYQQVWSLVQKIPYGRVATYGQVAKIIPQPENFNEEDYRISASRWVGLAMAACPDHVPWHRVVNSQGKISHPHAGEQRKRLVEEGVLLLKDKIDLNNCQWRGLGQSDETGRQGQLF